VTGPSNGGTHSRIQYSGSMPPESERPVMTAVALRSTVTETADVELAIRGDGVAFERLYRAHVARVYSLARWLLGGDDVDDAVQEIFIRVWEKLGTFSGQSAFGTWLHRVAVNHLIRRRSRRAVHWGREAADDTAVLSATAPRARPELRVAIENAVEQLPAGAREVFVLHDMEGYRHEEIAGMLGVDPGTSRSQLHRARMLLRKAL
jgi:RNA polymerase sigma-70 factor, ECF subfamily